ncbi:hypothetical protein [Martelella sp. HB161492]|uniref:hypothetical protein n=1 Tax=Martelella sp. HB161492 TaxID=2720726 RepID=UPI00159114C1|nr:hypothetical protein [Martelella sp. HB161492]
MLRDILSPVDFDRAEFGTRYAFAIVLACAAGTLFLDYLRYPELFEPGTALFSDQLAFFRDAEWNGLRTIFRPDFNYISLIPRLLAGVGEFLHIRPAEAGLFYQVIGALLRGALLGLLALNIFRALVRSDGLRWLAVVILVTIGNHQLRFVYNVGYAQIFAMTLILALACQGRGQRIERLLMVACVLSLTKILSVITLPLQVLAFVRQRGTGRLLAGIMILLTLANLAVAVTVAVRNPGMSSWLSNPAITLPERLATGLAIPGTALMQLLGVEGLSAIAAALAGAALLILAVAVNLRRGPVALGLFGTWIICLAYAGAAAMVVTRFLNWAALTTDGMLFYHVFPVYGFVLVLFMALVDALMSGLARRLGPLAPGFARVVPLVLAFAMLHGWSRSIAPPDLMYRAEATASMWQDGWRSVEFPDGRAFCIPTPYTFHAPYSTKGCALLDSAPVESRLVWEGTASPEQPMQFDMTQRLAPGAEVMGFLLYVRTVGAFDETMRFDILVNGQAIDARGPLYAKVKGGNGGVLFIPFDKPVPDVRSIELIPDRPVQIMRDQNSKIPYSFVFGRNGSE